jgi:predicted solute-binding protein
MANFSTESWLGSLSQHLLSKKQKLLDFKKTEDNENVIRWIDEYVSELEVRIEEAKIREERQD